MSTHTATDYFGRDSASGPAEVWGMPQGPAAQTHCQGAGTVPDFGRHFRRTNGARGRGKSAVLARGQRNPSGNFATMQPRHLEAVTFSAKAAVSALAAVLVYSPLHLPGSPWVAAVSAVVVTQQTLDSSYKAALQRVGANVGGALTGAVLDLLTGRPLVAMTLGILLTGLGGYALKLTDLLRPAFVAVILVTLGGGTGEWGTSRNRVLGVIAGCACALAVGFLFDKLSERVKLRFTEKLNPPDQQE